MWKWCGKLCSVSFRISLYSSRACIFNSTLGRILLFKTKHKHTWIKLVWSSKDDSSLCWFDICHCLLAPSVQLRSMLLWVSPIVFVSMYTCTHKAYSIWNDLCGKHTDSIFISMGFVLQVIVWGFILLLTAYSCKLSKRYGCLMELLMTETCISFQWCMAAWDFFLFYVK